MSTAATYHPAPTIDPTSADEVRALIARAAAADGVAPISEQQFLRLSGTDPHVPWRHVLARAPGGELVGYAVVDPATETPEAELIVDPAHRRKGIGTALLQAVRELTGGQDASAPTSGRGTLVWSHGTSDAAALFAAHQHAEATRILWQLRRPAGPLPPAQLTDNITIRAFEPADADAWLAVNAAAFAGHPEQGSWTAVDLAARLREPWFDPTGFLLAVAGPDGAGELPPGALAGFHWTKVHGPSTAQLRTDPALYAGALGEVYVVGIDPRAQGLGLGRALTIAGLTHLQERGIPDVLLYVDDSNTAAMRLYRGLGFAEFSRDTQYRLG